MPMQRWMQSAAGGTSQRLTPAFSIVCSRSRIPPPAPSIVPALSTVAIHPSLAAARAGHVCTYDPLPSTPSTFTRCGSRIHVAVHALLLRSTPRDAPDRKANRGITTPVPIPLCQHCPHSLRQHHNTSISAPGQKPHPGPRVPMSRLVFPQPRQSGLIGTEATSDVDSKMVAKVGFPHGFAVQKIAHRYDCGTVDQRLLPFSIRNTIRSSARSVISTLSPVSRTRFGISITDNGSVQ